jgi:hypothetical protein
VFPLSERSGVNLRGEYGPTWEGINVGIKKVEEAKSQEVKLEQEDNNEPKKVDVQDDQMQVDGKEAKRPVQKTSEKKEGVFPLYTAPQLQWITLNRRKSDFYDTFWSLQLPFSKPHIFVAPEMFAEFKNAVDEVLPVIKEATAKEWAMMGSRAGVGAGSLKRKREPEIEEHNANTYAKPSTSEALSKSVKIPEPPAPSDVALSVPRPVITNGSSPLHPSLPPKPGSSPIKPPPSPAPTPTITVTAVPVPTPVPAPSEPPQPPIDKEIPKYEEVGSTSFIINNWRKHDFP